MAEPETILKDLAIIQKDPATQIRIHISEYRGRRYLVFREFFQGSDGSYRAGKAGINIGEQHHAEVLEAVKRGLEEIAPSESRSGLRSVGSAK